MSESFITSVVTVIMAIIGVAILAVLVSPRAQTGNVLSAGANAFSSILGSALSPVTGGGFTGIAPGLSITG